MSNAVVGMMYPVFAPLLSHTPGSMPQYGQGRVIQEGREVTINKTFSDNPLYGDDEEQDNDNGLTGISYDFESTGLDDEDRVFLFGETANANTVTGGYWEGDNETPYGGFGHIRKMRNNKGTGSSSRTYEAWICLKIKFQETSQTARTKEGNQISWGTPRLSGQGASLDVDGSGVNKFRLHRTFNSASEAKAWINGILNVSAVTT